MRIGERLRAARRERNMSLTDLARATRLSKGFISQVESGISNPSLASLHKLTAALGLPPGAFFAEEHSYVQPGSEQPTGAGVGCQMPGVGSFWQPTSDTRYPTSDASGGEVPELGVFSLDSVVGGGIVPVTSGGAQGTAALMSIAGGVTLYGAEPLQPVNGPAFCAVLKGEVRVGQGGAIVTGRQGEVVTFDPGKVYTLSGRGMNAVGGGASLFLMLPAGCLLPARSDLDPAAPPPAHSFPRTGPFRLVEMRAMRGTTRERGR